MKKALWAYWQGRAVRDLCRLSLVLAVVGVVWALAGCQDVDTPRFYAGNVPSVSVPRDIRDVTLTDGTRCIIFYHGGYDRAAGGITCNWSSRDDR